MHILKNVFYLLICVSVIVGFGFGFFPKQSMTGVYWGAFDPPTSAHEAIITTSLNEIPLKELIVVVNNHSYKNYTFPLEKRLEWIKEIVRSNGLKNVEVLYQDDKHKLDFAAFKEMHVESICGIAGYDAYKSWIQYSTPEERALYDAIAVIPRGDDDPILFDKAAFILPINPVYKYVSSTAVRESLNLQAL